MSENNSIIFVPGNVPSSKNSKVATSKGVFNSKAVSKYLSGIGVRVYSVRNKIFDGYKTKPMLFPVEELKSLFSDVRYPAHVGLHFVRSSKAKFDFHNISQIIFDLLVACDAIPDDNMDYIIPYAHMIDDRYYSVDKDNPGVYIVVQK